MEEEHKRETEQLKHSSEMSINALENKLSHVLVQQARDEAAMKQLKSELSAHKAHIDMLGSRLEQVTADVHLQYKNEIQDLRDVISVEQEEKKDMHRKLQNAGKRVEDHEDEAGRAAKGFHVGPARGDAEAEGDEAPEGE
ncbi:hypothetical protein SORBI_3004G039000 [Sorghum bicolor]|uniref:Uncharacterized protein n=1 Tax=Sorghum bicolor TaxID=4558 RepID=A0A194YMP6_SORBI|nr:hypothetical protein SORBI_3004G039000 [Sorghum bicolor]